MVSSLNFSDYPDNISEKEYSDKISDFTDHGKSLFVFLRRLIPSCTREFLFICVGIAERSIMVSLFETLFL